MARSGGAAGENSGRGATRRGRRLGAAALVAALAGLVAYGYGENWHRSAPPLDLSGPVAGWDRWGGDDGGSRYSPLTQITPENVWALKPAWRYHIGRIAAPATSSATFEATPIIADGKLFTCNGITRVVALDPETGREIWGFDPKSDNFSTYQLNCRGVTHAVDPQVPAGQPCARKIFVGTLDMRLLALDAATGRQCARFGAGGIVDLRAGLGAYQRGDMAVSSPPVVIGGRIVVNARVIDNVRTDVPAGAVRAFDLTTGKLAWAWDALPPGMAPRPDGTLARSTPNSWAPMSADPALGLVFVPMGNAPPDHFGGDRHGLDHYASSVVALDAATGKVRWHFQTVHHDLWDYDLPSQPVLFDLPRPGGAVPALAQATKQGHLFILDRRTGTPLFPVEERPVPQTGGVPGEHLAPTQPFPANPAFVLRARDLTEADMFGFTPYDRAKCRATFRAHDYRGVFTPPSTRGWIEFPSFMGATNWGGVSIDPARGILIANTTQAAAIMRLIPRAEADRRLKAGEQLLPGAGSPYGLTMGPMLSPFGAPCNPPPWGTLVAIDLRAGRRLWEVPLGTTRDQAPFPIWLKLGVPNLGGSVITASGLVFIGATTDRFLRAFDIRTGTELWTARLPAGGNATPMTYRLRKDGRQFVVIAAGGHKYLGTGTGDELIAYALPDPR